jgi:predicted dienelactone hydrolase
VSNARQYDFLSPCSDALASIAPAICTSLPGFDRAAFHVGFDSAVVKFFKDTPGNH